MRPKVYTADTNGQLPPELVTLMNLLCGLSTKYTCAYFSFHAHPHTMRVSDFATIIKPSHPMRAELTSHDLIGRDH
jgi:hypothetical protein